METIDRRRSGSRNPQVIHSVGGYPQVGSGTLTTSASRATLDA
jgi:hypothetical protein